MRLLNKNEQDLCLRILRGEGDNNYLGNIIDHKLEGVRISVMHQPKNVELLFTIQSTNPTQEETEMVIYRVKEISTEILTVVNLITILEKDGYIMLLQRANQIPNKSEFGRGIGNMPSISSHFADSKVSELLIEYTTKEIFITEEFRQFCNHRFIARDEQRFRRQIRVTTSALFVAIAAMLLNTSFNLLPKSSNEDKVSKEQMDSISANLLLISSKLDSINTNVKRLSINLAKGQGKSIKNKTNKSLH